MQLTCPCCHAHIPLEAALQDDAGRELVAMLASMPAELARPLVHYLSFFRPAKQQLGWGRALRLAREVLALLTDQAVLAAALIEAARSLDDKRTAPGWKPLGNHNYLRRCMETAGVRAEASAVVATAAAAQPSAAHRAVLTTTRQGSALVALQAMKGA